MSPDPAPGVQRPHRAVAALGVATIVAYGGWSYAFSVLIQPIADDTGWPVALLGGTYAAGQLLAGVGSIAGGSLLDRLGGRVTFGSGGVLGGGLLLLASYSRSPAMFAVSFAAAAGVIGGLGFYHVTMAAARRAVPDSPTRAIAHLTLWGALASPIFLPLAAVLVGAVGWRGTLAVLGATTAVGLLLAAVVVPGGRAAAHGTSPDVPLRSAAASVWSDPATRRLVAAVCAGGFGTGVVLTYQVPIMLTAGLPLGVASTLAGARGLCQILGRVGLVRAVDRVGARRALAVVMLTTVLGAALLVGSSTVLLGVAFAVVAGSAMGATSPLQGIHAAELLPARHLSALLGALQALGGVALAIGPLVGGLSATLLGTYTPAVALAGLSFGVGGLVLLAGGGPTPTIIGDGTDTVVPAARERARARAGAGARGLADP